MKKNIQLLTIAFAASVCLTVSACKKDKKEDTTPTPVVTTGTIAFHFHTNVDTVEIEDYDSVNIMTGGRQITVSKAQLYVSNIQLVKLDGSTVDISGVIKLKTKEIEEYELGHVPAGNYKSVKFNVGLSATTNAATPAAADSTLHQPGMWFDPMMAQPDGFVFVNFQGTIDTTTAANGSVLVPFFYKIGTNANLKTVTMPDQNFTVSPNQIQFVHMTIDYAMLFDGIKLNNINNLTMNTIAANATALGTQLANNIAMMFSYEM
jgi:hypothetical protein